MAGVSQYACVHSNAPTHDPRSQRSGMFLCPSNLYTKAFSVDIQPACAWQLLHVQQLQARGHHVRMGHHNVKLRA